jgi:hypothetical protein
MAMKTSATPLDTQSELLELNSQSVSREADSEEDATVETAPAKDAKVVAPRMSSILLACNRELKEAYDRLSMINEFENWTPEQFGKNCRKEQTAIRKRYKANHDNAANDLVAGCFGAWQQLYFANKQWREKIDNQIMESFTTGFLADVSLDEAILRISFESWSQWLNRKKSKKHNAQRNVKCPKVAVWGTPQTTNRMQVKPSISPSKLAQFRHKIASSMKQQQPVSLHRAIGSYTNQKRAENFKIPPYSSPRCAAPAKSMGLSQLKVAEMTDGLLKQQYQNSQLTAKVLKTKISCKPFAKRVGTKSTAKASRMYPTTVQFWPADCYQHKKQHQLVERNKLLHELKTRGRARPRTGAGRRPRTNSFVPGSRGPSTQGNSEVFRCVRRPQSSKPSSSSSGSGRTLKLKLAK